MLCKPETKTTHNFYYADFFLACHNKTLLLDVKIMEQSYASLV